MWAMMQKLRRRHGAVEAGVISRAECPDISLDSRTQFH